MEKINRTPRGFRALVILCLGFLVACSDEEILPTSPVTDPVISATATTSDCGCTYTVPSNSGTSTVDGNVLGLKAGAVICLKAGNTYGNIVFKNLRGAVTSPITIRNCGGTVTLNATGKAYGIKTQLSSFVRITGGSGTTYGIKVNGGHHSVTLEYLTTNIEVDHLEVYNSGFSGIMAKTDPTCDNATNRGYFVMKDVDLHDNFIHDTGGEGFYVGHTFWDKGVSLSCGTKYPHALEDVKIYNNIIKNAGWEAIQVGSTPTGAKVYNNRIENYGAKNVVYQNNGVQFGEGAPGEFFGNFIKGGKGTALMLIGNAQNFVHDNVIVNAGADGIFCDERAARGNGFRFINNTIINPKLNGIRIYTEYVTMNTVQNNIIVNPGSYASYTYPRSGNDAYVYLLSKTVKIASANNHQTRDIATVKFVSPSADNFALAYGSPAINKGFNISTLNIQLDFAGKPRLRGTSYDVGAYEYQ